MKTRAQPAQGADSEARRAPASAWYALAILLMTTLFAYVDRQMLSLIGPSLHTSLHFSDLQIGMLQGLGMAIFASVASYPMGWLADRFGRRLILAIGVFGWSVATFSCAFQHSFGGLLASTIGISVGEAGLAPIVYAMIPDLFPERQRNTANFIFYGGSLLGAGGGMALGGAVLQWLASSHAALPAWLAGVDAWRIAMMIAAAPGPLFFLLVLTMPLGRRRALLAEARAEPGATAGFLPYLASHWRALACVYGSLFTMGMATQAALVWFPLALPRAFGIEPASVGVGLGVVVVVATLVGVLLPPLALRLRRGRDRPPLEVARIFVWLSPLPAAFLPFVTSPSQAYLVAAVQGTLGVAASSLFPGVLQDLAPGPLRSRVLAILGISNAFALAVSPMAIGLLSTLMPGRRGMLQAIAMVSVPSLIASAVLISLAARPYATTVRTLRLQLAEETA